MNDVLDLGDEYLAVLMRGLGLSMMVVTALSTISP
jgi:hypothetical protein